MKDVGKRAVTYARVSTDAQEREGFSLETQERACIERALSRGWDIVESIRDSDSAGTLERPGLERLRRMVRGGEVGVIVAYDPDRLSRDQWQMGVIFDEAKRYDVQIETVLVPFNDSPMGKLVMSLLAGVAEIERALIVDRTTRGKVEKARELGRLTQGTGVGLYGYHLVEGRRVANEAQAPVVQRIFADFLAGNSTMGIANALNAEGVPTMTGKLWASATIYHLLRNQGYTGTSIYRRTHARLVAEPGTGRMRRRSETRPPEEQIEIKGCNEVIIDADSFARVQAMLDDPERRKRGRPKRTYRLRGHVRCARCGAAMTGQTLTNGQKPYYRCRRAYGGATKHDRCDGKYVRAEVLENAVMSAVADILARPQIILAEAERRRAELAKVVDVNAIQRKLTNLDQEQARLLDNYETGLRTKAQFDQKLADIRRRREHLERQLEPVRALPSLPEADALQQACGALREWLLTAQGDRLVLILSALDIRVVADVGTVRIEGALPTFSSEGSQSAARFTVEGTMSNFTADGGADERRC